MTDQVKADDFTLEYPLPVPMSMLEREPGLGKMVNRFPLSTIGVTADHDHVFQWTFLLCTSSSRY